VSRRRARRARKAKPPLNARQQAFVRHYTAGEDGVRGNLTQSYIAAGYTARGNVAETAAARLFRNVRVRDAIDAAHAKAEEAAAARLRDWKELAPGAQSRLLEIAEGRIPGSVAKPPRRGRGLQAMVIEGAPDTETGQGPARIGDRDDAAAAKVILDANLEILERAQPKKLQIAVEDPAGALAALLGVKPEAVPPGEDES